MGFVESANVVGEVGGPTLRRGEEEIHRGGHPGEDQHARCTAPVCTFDIGVQAVTDHQGVDGTGAAHPLLMQGGFRFACHKRFLVGGVGDHSGKGPVARLDTATHGGRSVVVADHEQRARGHGQRSFNSQIETEPGGISLDYSDRAVVDGRHRAQAVGPHCLAQPGVPDDQYR